MAYKIELHSDDLDTNHRYALKIFNQQNRDSNGVKFYFIQDKDKQVCLVTTCKDERDKLPECVKIAGISYRKLKNKVLS